MQPHEERVITEKTELDAKLEKLKAFCFGNNPAYSLLSPEDRDLLEDQYTIMEQYSKILAERISRFTKPVSRKPYDFHEWLTRVHGFKVGVHRNSYSVADIEAAWKAARVPAGPEEGQPK